MIEFKYRPDVDGLRAVAVTIVLLFHCGLGFSGGYVGVDVFFVISGYLITGLILKEQSTETFSIAEFWGRRIRRIIPAATLVGVVCLCAGWVFLLPGDLKKLAASLVAQQAMLSNAYFWRNTDYFAGPSETMPLLHTWSLAVEEQFYLGFPLLLIVLKRFKFRIAASIMLSFAVVSLLVSEWAVSRHPTAAFFLLPSRAWELLLGALLVYCPEPRRIRRRWKELGAWTGIALILAAGTCFNSETRFPGIAAMVPCVGTFLIIYFNSFRETSLSMALANKNVVFVGLISYSLYLWHWPILAFTRYWIGLDLPLDVRFGVLVASFLFAVASWRFVETPFRKGFVGARTVKLVAGAIASATVVIGVSQWVNIKEGFPTRFPESIRKLAEPIVIPDSYVASIQAIRDGKLPTLGLPRRFDEPPDFLVWGECPSGLPRV
jgi:peptidoglycan/LPS O-acetylase OafA/YrhL